MWRVEYGAQSPIPEDTELGKQRQGDSESNWILAHTHFDRLEDAWVALLTNAEAEHEIRIADLRKAEQDLIRSEQEAGPHERMKLMARRALERCCDMERRSAHVLDRVRQAHNEWLDRQLPMRARY